MKKGRKILIFSVLGIGIGGAAALGALSYASQNGEPMGLVDGRLAPCPDSPNGVSSEPTEPAANRILPLAITGSSQHLLESLKKVILAEGGTVSREAPDYLAATFRTGIFKFVDDVEFRVAEDKSVIHVRSASRVGHSDFGANRKRVEAIRRRLEATTGATESE
jgi:uncharacterized protein (DUF1499 family)